VEFMRDDLDREFPSRRHGVQFNHAAVAPLPARAAQALARYSAGLTGRAVLDWKEWGREADLLRERAARLIGADESVGGARSVSVVPNTTSGLAYVASGLDWRPGDSIVTTQAEFPANLAPWLDLARLGVAVRRIPTRDGAFTAEEIAAACDSRTRLVSLSAVAFHTGFVAPAEAVGAFCRERGILFGLDAIQAVGAVKVDVVRAQADFLSADGHKWMLGPEGCGILFTTPAFRQRLRAPSGWQNMKRSMPGDFRIGETIDYVSDAVRFEVGALPTPGVYALAASLELLLEIGMETVRERIAEVLAVLQEGLPRLGWEPVLFDGPPRSGILSAHPPAGVDPRAVVQQLELQGIAVTARAGFLRLSPHVENDVEEAERLLSALRSAG
jgi:cysteine desulfurase / selenocysteine lyase